MLSSQGLTCAVVHLFRPNRRLRSIRPFPFGSPVLDSPLSSSFSISNLQRLPRHRSLRSLSTNHTASSSSLPPKVGSPVAMEEKNPERQLYRRMRLWEFPDQYIIESTEGNSDSYLSVSRVDGSFNLIEGLPHQNTVRGPKIRTVFGVIGMLKLLAGSYMAVITERECVGSYLGHPIFRVSSLHILPCNQSLKNSSVEQNELETEFSTLLNAAERTSGLYFSYDVNLTLSAQRLHELGDESKLLPLWRQADPRYVWNNYMLEMLIENKLHPYLLPVVQGSFQHFQAAIEKDIIDVTLIARRCIRRAGTRLWRRGADPDGYVANFVETEQILQAKGYKASFVQIRGSIPILWQQIVDLTYKPKFEILRPGEGPRVAERHFLDLRKSYGSVLAVDLVNKHGGEGHLCEKYASAMQKILSDDIRYVHFDFHRICGHIHFDRLSILYDQIADILKKNGYFMLDTNGEKVKEQLGVVRTNCVDCLDRTNATQSMIGRKMLESQLQQIGIFDADEIISSHPHFDESFKILWANHGDEISIQYSGTPALKRDLVRYGKQTIPGFLMDGWNAVSRYYLNNFVDGTKQDAIDLIHGHYIVSVSRDMTSPSRGKSLHTNVSLPLLTALSVAGIMFAMMSLRQARHDSRHFFLAFVWAGVSYAIASFVRTNGRKFCSRPRLNPPESTTKI